MLPLKYYKLSWHLAAKQDYELSYKLEQGEKQRFELGDSTLFW